MALLDIHLLGSPILRRETEVVTAVTPELRRLADDMFDTMEAAKGVGLAAPQVGRPERLCVIEVEEQRIALINPEIIHREGSVRWEEGCLSIPEVFAEVDRAARVRVRALNLDGQPFEIEGSELLGVAMQHEIDHLHGKLFLDRLSLLKRRAALKAWDRERLNYPTGLRVLPVTDVREGSSATATGSAADDDA